MKRITCLNSLVTRRINQEYWCWGRAIISRSHTYDAAGNRSSLADNEGTTTFTFNGLNQLTKSQSGSKVIFYDYDANGNIESEIVGGGQSQTYYEFTPEGTMSTISTQGMVGSYYAEMKYDANGTRVRRTGDDSG